MLAEILEIVARYKNAQVAVANGVMDPELLHIVDDEEVTAILGVDKSKVIVIMLPDDVELPGCEEGEITYDPKPEAVQS